MSDNAPEHGRLSRTEGPAGRCSPQDLSSVVEVMFRKARLKRSFRHIFRRQQGGNEHPNIISAASASELVAQPPGVVGDPDARVERRIPFEQPEPPPPLEELHPGRAEGVVQPRSPERSALAVDPPPSREEGEGEDEAEQARRRVLLRRFFHAARRREFVGRNDRLDLGQRGTPAAAGGAPCFTVGGRGASSVTNARPREQHGPSDVNAGALVDDNGGARLRRANLLRRILHALRYMCFVQNLSALLFWLVLQELVFTHLSLLVRSIWWIQLYRRT